MQSRQFLHVRDDPTIRGQARHPNQWPRAHRHLASSKLAWARMISAGVLRNERAKRIRTTDLLSELGGSGSGTYGSARGILHFAKSSEPQNEIPPYQAKSAGSTCQMKRLQAGRVISPPGRDA